MPETATFNVKKGYVYVYSFGTVSLTEVQDCLKNVSALLEEHQSLKLMVDVRKQEVALQLIDTFTFSKEVVITLPNNIKIAYIVNDPPQHSQSFFTLMASCLGHPVEVFFSIEKAEAWFENNYDPKSNPFYGTVKFPSLSVKK